MKTVRDVLRRHKDWDLLVFIEGSKIKVYDKEDFLSWNIFNNVYGDNGSCVCNYVMFNYGRVNLLIISLMVESEVW